MEIRRNLPRGVSMDGLWGEGWQADRDVFGAFRAGSAVLNPFARMSDDRLAGGDVQRAVLTCDAKGAFKHQGEFVELRFLARFNPTARAAHVGQAEARLTAVYPADKFIDQFWFITRGSDAGWSGDESWHKSSFIRQCLKFPHIRRC